MGNDIYERHLKAAKFCARVAIDRQKAEKRADRFVKRLFIGSAMFFMWAVALAVLVA